MAYLVAYRSARCHTLNHTTIDGMALLRDLYFNDRKLIHPHLIQLYHTPLSSDKRKRTDEDSDDETDHHNKKNPKLAIDTDNNRTVQHVINP